MASLLAEAPLSCCSCGEPPSTNSLKTYDTRRFAKPLQIQRLLLPSPTFNLCCNCQLCALCEGRFQQHQKNRCTIDARHQEGGLVCNGCVLRSSFRPRQPKGGEKPLEQPAKCETTQEKRAKKQKREHEQATHFNQGEARKHICHARSVANQTTKLILARQTQELQSCRTRTLKRLSCHFPEIDGGRIQEIVSEHAGTEASCGTSLVFADLVIINTSLNHAAASGKMPATFGEGRAITLMVSGLFHGSTPAHQVAGHMGNLKQQCAATAKIARERGGVEANHHPAIAIQVPLSSSTRGATRLFPNYEGLPLAMSSNAGFQAWASERYRLNDLHESTQPRPSTQYTTWVAKHFFYLQLQYQFETAMQLDVKDLLRELNSGGIAYEILTVENRKNVTQVHDHHASRYPVFTQCEQDVVEQLAASAHSSRSSSRSSSSSTTTTRSSSKSRSSSSSSGAGAGAGAGGGGAATFPAFIGGENPTTYLCSLVTIIQDTHGRLLVAYLPEISSRANTEQFFSCFGDGYLDKSLRGQALNTNKVKRPTVHSASNTFVHDRQQAMTMLGVRADACNRKTDGKLPHESQQLHLYKIHTKKTYKNVFGDLEKFKTAFDPAVTEWRALLPRFFQLVSYCNKDMMGAARCGYANDFIPPSLDSLHVISNAGYSDSYPSPSHHDPDLGFCFAFAGKCYLKYMCRECDEITGEVKWQAASGTK